jgi:hypothetical protein
MSDAPTRRAWAEARSTPELREWAAGLSVSERRDAMREIIFRSVGWEFIPGPEGYLYLPALPPIGLSREDAVRLASLVVVDELMASSDVPTFRVASGTPHEQAARRAAIVRRLGVEPCEICSTPSASLFVMGGAEHWRCVEHRYRPAASR